MSLGWYLQGWIVGRYRLGCLIRRLRWGKVVYGRYYRIAGWGLEGAVVTVYEEVQGASHDWSTERPREEKTTGLVSERSANAIDRYAQDKATLALLASRTSPRAVMTWPAWQSTRHAMPWPSKSQPPCHANPPTSRNPTCSYLPCPA